jgi:hypothetical protein
MHNNSWYQIKKTSTYYMSHQRSRNTTYTVGSRRMEKEKNEKEEGKKETASNSRSC